MTEPASNATPAAFDATLRVRTRYWLAVLAGAALLAAGAAWIVSLLSGHTDVWRAFVYFAFMGGAFVALSARLASDKKKEHRARVVVDERGVVIEGKVALARADIAPGAHLRPLAKGELSVRIPSRRTFGALDLGVASEAEGLALLTALGQDPAHAKVRFRLASGFENKTLRQLATLFIAMSSSCGGVVNGHGLFFNALFLVWAIGFSIAALSFLLPTWVTVGADGLLVERRGRKRFVPFADVKSVEPHVQYPDAVVVETASGDPITLRTSVQDRTNASIAMNDDTRALKSRLDGAFAAFKARTKTGDALLQLKRGGRSAKEWIASLAVLRKERGYREVRVTDEALWSVLEDPTALPEDRAAALVALRESADEQTATRQRVAMEACAEPRLRVVYDAARENDEAALERALEELRETAEK